MKVKFEWDENKNQENIEKHGVSFELAQYAFADPQRVIAEDITHSQDEQRYYCFWQSGRRHYYRSLHFSWQNNPYYWGGLLAQREENS